MALLVHEDLHIAADERQAARQGLVNHHADAVPVARGGDGGAGRLFGSHVSRGADDSRPRCSGASPPPLLGGETEVEQDDPARWGHHHV